MSSKEGTSYGGDDRGGNQKEQKKVIKNIQKAKEVSEGKKYVAKEIGLVEKKAGPMSFLQTGKTTGYYTVKEGKTSGFYGKEASQATNEYLVDIGQATRSSQNPDGSWNYNLTSKGKEMKYGKSESAMGSGDPSGIMTSTAISQPMHKHQQKVKALTLGVLSAALPMGAGQLMRAAAASSYGSMGQAGYNKYLGKFYSNVAGETSSYAPKGTTNGRTTSGGEFEVSSANIDTTRTGGKTRTDDDTRFKSVAAVTKGSSAVDDTRTLLKKTSKTITAKRISV